MNLTTQEVKAVTEQVLADYIFPLPSPTSSSSSSSSKRQAQASTSADNVKVASGSGNASGSDVDEVAWTDRLLLTMRFMDESAVGGLLNVSGIKTMYVQSTSFSM